MRNNRLAGPDHVAALLNALQRNRRPGAYARPPATGGDQISMRLSESLLAHLDVLGKASGWTRVQVLTALIERGLFDLYEVLDDDIGESIMENLANELVPTMGTYTYRSELQKNGRWTTDTEYKDEINGVTTIIDRKRLPGDFPSQEDADAAALQEINKLSK